MFIFIIMFLIVQSLLPSSPPSIVGPELGPNFHFDSFTNNYKIMYCAFSLLVSIDNRAILFSYSNNSFLLSSYYVTLII